MCITSPPYYGLRAYGAKCDWPDGWHGELGQEKTFDQYVSHLADVFDQVKRVLTPTGTFWLNMGDCYSGSAKGQNGDGQEHSNIGSKQRTNTGAVVGGLKTGLIDGLPAKNLVGVPWKVAFELQSRGWILRSDIVWQKPNAFPESVKDRPTRSHEYVFMLAKNSKYYFDAESVKEPTSASQQNDPRVGNKELHASKRVRNVGGRTDGYTISHGGGLGDKLFRNVRDVWSINTKPFKGAHFATFPPELAEKCIRAGSPLNGIVLDCFAGSGTAIMIAKQLGRTGVGIELSEEYCEMARERIDGAEKQQRQLRDCSRP